MIKKSLATYFLWHDNLNKRKRWFLKIVPVDVGAPDFLFEWTVILYLNGKINKADRKAVETHKLLSIQY